MFYARDFEVEVEAEAEKIRSRYHPDQSGVVMARVLELLKKHFGYDQFRGPQESVIQHVISGGSGLVMMPTGMGKSLCYQIPSLELPGLTLVVSPLIALAQDQVQAARAKGIKATQINSSIEKSERQRRWQSVAEGKIRLLYVTPERLKMPEFWNSVESCQISLLAVDEAHCMSQWGHDFRPEYARIGERRRQMGSPPVLALTATATLAVQKEIREKLGIENDPVWRTGLERPNLNLAVLDVYGIEEKIRSLVGIRYQNPGSMIVYCTLVSTLEKLSFELQRLQIDHTVYHGQLSDQHKVQNQKQFMIGEKSLILATPAFGLGIDKEDVRSVVHFEVPGSIEAYFQEVGRAGRDGKTSNCILLYDQEDVSIQMDFLKWTNPDPEFVRSTYRLIEKNLQRVKQEGSEFLRGQLLFYNRRDFRLETAMNWLERWGSLEWPHHDYRHLKIIQEPEGEWLDQDMYEHKKRAQNTKLLELVRWVQTEDCRSDLIYQYFGQASAGSCGTCDNCVGQK